MSNRKKIIIWGCGSALVLMLLIGGVVVMFLKHLMTDTQGAVVHVVVPSEVTVDETFDLEVHVKNDRAKDSLKIDDIDIHDEYLEGFMVVSTEPKHKSTTHVPIDNSQSFTFDQALKPGQTNRFVFSLKAVKAGIFRGDVDVTEGVQFVSEMAQTVVKEKEKDR
jgi:hypothetical protein